MFLRTVRLLVGTVTVFGVSSIAFDANDVICQRLPDNPNCPNSRRAPAPSAPSQWQSQRRPQVQLQTQPQPQMSPQVVQAPPNRALSIQDLREGCLKLKGSYDAHCATGAVLSADEKAYCDLYVERCMNTGYAVQSQAPVGFSGNQLPRKTFAAKWMQLTHQAEQKEQIQQMDSAEKWLYDCGIYDLEYNTLCYPNASNFICNSLRRICLTHAEDLAAGQTPVLGPYAYNHGLPTGGAGSSRPLTWGNNVEIGPFFNLGANKAINPLQGYGQSVQLQVPVAGVAATISKGVDYGGLIGISQLGQLLDGRRRRRSIKLSDLLYHKNE